MRCEEKMLQGEARETMDMMLVAGNAGQVQK